MSEVGGLRLAPSAALKERRLASLLQGRDPQDPLLVEAVEDAQLLGTLELAGSRVSWEEVKAERRGEAAPESILALRRAQRAVDVKAPFGIAALRAWDAALSGTESVFRRSERTREGVSPAPPAFIESRLAVLEEWLKSEGASSLRPVAQAALALARIVEILPFEDGNGRISRLAASHLMTRGGLRPPILVGGDAPRLRATLEAAFRFETEPLVRLLEEASERCLDVMIQTLERG
jgi:hypothetical protein